MTVGAEGSEERRLRRRSGDPRITSHGREILRRVTRGDLSNDFQAALDVDLRDDPVLGDEGQEGRATSD